TEKAVNPTDEAATAHETEKLLNGSFSLNEAIESCGFGKFQWIVSGIGGFAWVACAMVVMLLSVLSPSLECEWKLTPVEQALSTTSLFLGWMISSPVWGRICDLYGRKKGIVAASIVGLVSGVLTAFSPNYTLFLVARFAVGCSVGGLPQSVTLTAEFLPTSVRARCLTLIKCFWAIGAAAEAGLALVVLPTLGWRWLVSLSAVPLAGLIVVCWWMPESPRFDVASGRLAEAKATLERIAKCNGKSLPEGELVEEIETSSTNMRELLYPKHRRTTIQLFIIWTLLGLLYFAISIYTPILLQSDRCNSISETEEDAQTRLRRAVDTTCKQLSTESYMNIIITTMAEVPGYILTVFTIEWIGRRGTFAGGFALYAVCFAAMCFCLPKHVIVALLFVARSSIGAIFQTGYIYTSEVYPTTLRAQGLGIGTGFGRMGSMIVPIIVQGLAPIDMRLPAVACCVGGIIAAITSALLPVETRPKKEKTNTKETA
ncbi:hypothetical protein PFISCL1PPCAC_27982, partial [Pristionchus fissidentatus]